MLKSFSATYSSLLSYALLGFEGICKKLNVDPKVGLTGNDFNERTEKFGNNFRAEPVAKSWFRLFWEALQDDMLRLLMLCALSPLLLI